MIRLRKFGICIATIIFIETFVLTRSQKCPFAKYQQFQPQPDLFQDASNVAAYAVASENAIKIATQPNIPPGISYNSLDSFLRSLISSDSINDRPQRAPNSESDSRNVVYKQKEALQCAIPPLTCANDPTNLYYRSIDGSCNNLQNPGYGMAKSRYSRILPPKFSDGVYSPSVSVTGAPLPNARLLSLSAYGEESLPDNFRTMATLQWGQLVAHDISLFTKQGAPENCCANAANKRCYPIALAPNGPITSGTGQSCLDFARSTSDYDAVCPSSGLPHSEKISLVTAFLDLSSVYGNSEPQIQKVRQYQGGLLKMSLSNGRHWLPIESNNNGECEANNQQCYSIPDSRNQFIPTIAILHTIIVREHNRIANILTQLNPHYTDEQTFQVARKILIGLYQKITYYDWLPLIIGASFAFANKLIYDLSINDFVNDYDETVNAAPYAGYATAAFRYGHHQIPGWFSLVSSTRNYNQTLRLSDHFERPELLSFLSHRDNFDSMIRGMTTQLQKRADGNIDKEIKHYFNRKASKLYGGDLKAFDIQRGRDFALPSYNEYRAYCGLPRAYDWLDFSREISIEKINLLRVLYASPDDIDLVLGGSLEAHAAGALLGPTFQCIIGKQFLKTRIGDRFFFELENQLSGFSLEQLTEIRKASVSSLFCNNGDYLQSIQPNPFISENIRNVLTSCNNIPQIDLGKWKEIPIQRQY